MADKQPASPERTTERLRSGIASSIPMRFESVEKDRVVMVMDVDHRVHQPMGLLHGGASMVLAESAASTGANLNCAEGMVALGQEINGNHIRGKREGWVRAVAVPVHVGRSSQVWSVEIRDEEEKLICISRVTMAVVPAPPGYVQPFTA
jgi:1,4-dihydroxy-2-naphthoyl-CoA hydrolase